MSIFVHKSYHFRALGSKIIDSFCQWIWTQACEFVIFRPTSGRGQTMEKGKWNIQHEDEILTIHT